MFNIIHLGDKYSHRSRTCQVLSSNRQFFHGIVPRIFCNAGTSVVAYFIPIHL